MRFLYRTADAKDSPQSIDRIDRLPNSTKQVAQTAAVLGRIFEYCAKVWNRSSSLLECDSCPTS